jgi:hypothetical protein
MLSVGTKMAVGTPDRLGGRPLDIVWRPADRQPAEPTELGDEIGLR